MQHLSVSHSFSPFCLGSSMVYRKSLKLFGNVLARKPRSVFFGSPGLRLSGMVCLSTLVSPQKRFPLIFLPARILPGLCLGPSSSQPHGGQPQPDAIALLLRRPAPRHRYSMKRWRNVASSWLNLSPLLETGSCFPEERNGLQTRCRDAGRCPGKHV